MLVIDLQGPSLLPAEQALLASEQVVGLILFGRNCLFADQVKALVQSVRAIRPELIILVDQEGGRVRRLREGFEPLPSMASLGRYFDQNPEAALKAAEHVAALLATQVQRVGIDLPLAPVVDLGGASRVIGDRAFHRDPEVVKALSVAFCRRLQRSGVAATAKHFPGHGGIVEDTHVEGAIDPRTFLQLQQADLIPFIALIEQGLPAVMPAHVIFPAVDDKPVGFSSVWLQQILRQALGFEGVIISDDLGMAAAAQAAGSLQGRCEAAIEAGCDLLLLCNMGQEAAELIQTQALRFSPLAPERLAPLRAGPMREEPRHSEALLAELAPFAE